MSSHNDAELLVLLVGMVGFGLYLIWKGFTLRRQREYIQETPTAEIESVSIGPAELIGTARPENGPLQAPFSDEECLVARWEVEEWHQTDDSSYWKTIDEGVDFTDFSIDDGTGTMFVDPTQAAEYVLTSGQDRVVRVDVDEPEPSTIQRFVARDGTPGDASNVLSVVDLGNQSGDRRYRQNLLSPGDEAYVYGAVRRESTGDGEARLVVGAPTEGVDTGLFMISDERESTLLDRRRWALLWRLPAGAALAALGVGGLLFFFGGV